MELIKYVHIFQTDDKHLQFLVFSHSKYRPTAKKLLRDKLAADYAKGTGMIVGKKINKKEKLEYASGIIRTLGRSRIIALGNTKTQFVVDLH